MLGKTHTHTQMHKYKIAEVLFGSQGTREKTLVSIPARKTKEQSIDNWIFMKLCDVKTLSDFPGYLQ